MALFPSISELFSSKPPPAPMTPAQQATSANANAATGGVLASPDGNPTVPNNSTLKSDGTAPAFPATPEGEASPLSGYKELWKATPDSTNANTLVPSITADPAAMLKAAQTIDFTKSMNPEMLALASKGDASALAGIINAAAQAGYAQAATASVNITKAALAQQANTFETKYAPHMFRDNASREAVNEAVLLAADPAAAPIVEAVRRQVAATFPTASAAEIAQHTNNYMKEFSQKAVELAGGRVQTREQLVPKEGTARAEPDWAKFFDVDPNSL